MDVTEFGIDTDSRLLFRNTSFSIVVIESGIVTVVSELSQNAAIPIDVTEFGIVTDSS